MDAGQLRLNIYVHQTKGTFWAYCPEFDLAASGHTPDEARQAVMGLIDEYLEEVQRRPGDGTPFRDDVADWDSVLVSSGLDKNRTLN